MAESKTKLSILISGSGIAGTALAYMLARQPSPKLELHVTVVERSPVPRTTGQAVDIRGPAVDVIKKLGLEPEIACRHTSETGLAFLNVRGDIVGQVNATGNANKQSATSEYEILRGDLAGLLVEGVVQAQKEGSPVEIVYGESVASLGEQADGVHVSFSEGKLSPQVFDVVVGADGIASQTRKMIFGPEDKREHVKDSGLTLAFFSISRIPKDDSLWRWCMLDRGRAMHLRPHSSQKTMGVYLSTCAPKPERTAEIDEILHSSVDVQKDYMRGLFTNAGWQSERLLEGMATTDDFYMSHWSRVVTPKWHKGHCAILGDAAHATMGVGTSYALLGAYLLSGELGKVESFDQIPTALENYENLLRRHVDKTSSGGPGMQWMNPQSTLGVRCVQTCIKTATMLRIPQLAMRFAGGETSTLDGLNYSDYGWKDSGVTA